MAHVQTTSIVAENRLLNSLRASLSALGRGILAIAEANSRIRQIESMSKLSDTELAKRGIRREDIVRHVFADRLHV